MQPLAGQTVYVSQYGQDLHSLDGVKIANPEGSNQYVRPMVSIFATTNEQGEYRIALGDGNFDIRPREGKPNSFSIGGESELRIDVLATIVESIEFTGLVTDPSGKQLAGAVVQSVSRNFHIGDWNAATGENGQFTVKRREGLAVIRALSADQSLAAITELAADASYREFQLAPVGSARGRLLNEDGQTPASV